MILIIRILYLKKTELREYISTILLRAKTYSHRLTPSPPLLRLQDVYNVETARAGGLA